MRARVECTYSSRGGRWVRVRVRIECTCSNRGGHWVRIRFRGQGYLE